MKREVLSFALLFFSFRFFCEAQCPTLTPFIQAVPNTKFPCNFSCNGMLIIDPGYINGTPPYTFTSNFGTVTPNSPNPGWTTITNLCAGQYVVVNITDAAGCTGQDNITMVTPDPLNPTITIVPSCDSLPNGSVTISNVPSWYFLRTMGVCVNNWCDYFWDPGCTGFIAFTQLQTGETTPFTVNNLAPGNYYFGISFEFTGYQYPWLGCTQYVSFTIPSSPLPSASITTGGSTTFCSGGSVVLNAQVAANRSYQWKKNGNIIPGAVLSSFIATTSGTYKVTVTNTITGCSKTTGTGTKVTVYSNPSVPITPQGPTTFCAGDSVLLKAPMNIGWTYQWKRNNLNINNATSNKYQAKTAGFYKVKVTNTHGCTNISPPVQVSVTCRRAEYSIAVSPLEVMVYPNPSYGDFVFEFSNASNKRITIEIFDAMGQRILSEEINDMHHTIRDAQLSNGIYLAKIISGTVVKKLKIIKSE